MLRNTRKSRCFLWRQNDPEVNYSPHSDLRGVVFPEEVSRNRKRDIVLGTWNVRSLYRAGSLTAVARELARYKLELVGVQEVRWDKWGTVRAGDYNFFLWKDLQEVGGSCGDWMELAKNRDRWRALVSTVWNLRVRKMRGIS
jgi:hypothetical protein